MIKSMTAFGRAKIEGADKDITVEIKSVNSRFFDCNVKMPRSLIFLEEKIKSYVQKNAVSRAKVDIFITVDSHENSVGTVSYDKYAVFQLKSTLFTKDVGFKKMAYATNCCISAHGCVNIIWL